MKSSSAPLPAKTDERPFNLTLRRNIGYYGSFFSLGLIVATLGPTLPELARQTGSHLREISLLFVARSFGFIVGAVGAGRIYDRVRGHHLLALGLFALALFASMVPLIPLLWLLVVVFFIQGVAGSAVSVGGNTLLLWANRERVGPLLGGLHFIWGVGAFLSPIVVASAMRFSGGIGLGYWILALAALPVCVWLLQLQSPVHLHKSEESAGGRANVPLTVMIWFFLFLYTGTEACFGNWIFTYAIKTGLSDSVNAAYLNSAFWGMLTLGRLAAIPLASRLRPRTILMIDLAGALLSVATMLIFNQSRIALWAGVCGAGLALASMFPITIAFAERRMPLSGKLTGIFFAGSSAGAMTLPWIVGQFFESVGPRMLMIMSLTGLIVEVAIFILMMQYPRRITEQPETMPDVNEVVV